MVTEYLKMFAWRGKMSRLVQIDESIFASKRKYNRGRLLKDNEKHKKVPLKGNKEKAINEKNYGRRLSG